MHADVRAILRAKQVPRYTFCVVPVRQIRWWRALATVSGMAAINFGFWSTMPSPMPINGHTIILIAGTALVFGYNGTRALQRWWNPIQMIAWEDQENEGPPAGVIDLRVAKKGVASDEQT